MALQVKEVEAKRHNIIMMFIKSEEETLWRHAIDNKNTMLTPVGFAWLGFAWLGLARSALPLSLVLEKWGPPTDSGTEESSIQPKLTTSKMVFPGRWLLFSTFSSSSSSRHS